MTLKTTKKLMIATFMGLILGLNGIVVFAAEAPPSIKISISGSGSAEKPPELNINIPSSGSAEKPPELNINIPSAGSASGSGSGSASGSGYPTDTSTKIKITQHDVSPKGFNPAVTTAKITYGISKPAIVQIKITDLNNQLVKELLKNQSLAAGNNYYQVWYGTDDKGYDSKIVPNGTYKYQILAKNPTTQEIEDTANGEINVLYAEEKTGVDQNNGNQDAQDNAVSVLQNEFKGDTSKTGPETIIYLAFPLAGYLIYLKRK